MQSRRMSLAEACASVAVGYGIAVLLNVTVLPAFGYSVTVADGLAIGVFYTVASILRAYVMRRIFNAIR